MATINFNAANTTFRQLLGNGPTYRVPQFQRDYSAWASALRPSLTKLTVEL